MDHLLYENTTLSLGSPAAAPPVQWDNQRCILGGQRVVAWPPLWCHNTPQGLHAYMLVAGWLDGCGLLPCCSRASDLSPPGLPPPPAFVVTVAPGRLQTPWSVRTAHLPLVATGAPLYCAAPAALAGRQSVAAP
jgi:hypothetical protein